MAVEQEAEAEYRRLVLNDDVDGVMELLTNRAVEERVLQVRGGPFRSDLPLIQSILPFDPRTDIG